jgi:hypothetical protein
MTARLAHSDVIITVDAKRDHRMPRMVDLARLDDRTSFGVKTATARIAKLLIDRVTLLRVLSD